MKSLRALSIRTILLATISVLTLLIALLMAKEMYVQWRRLADVRTLNEATTLGDRMFDFAEALSVERDITFFLLYAPDQESAEPLRARLEKDRKQTDATFAGTLEALRRPHFSNMKALTEEAYRRFAALRDLRPQADAAAALPENERNRTLPAHWFKEATASMLHTRTIWMQCIKRFLDVAPTAARHMRFKHMLGVLMEEAGQERALVGRLIVRNVNPTSAEQTQLLIGQGKIRAEWEQAATFAEAGGLFPAVLPAFREAQSHYFTLHGMVGDVLYEPSSGREASYPIGIDFWFELASQAADSFNGLKDAALRETGRHMDAVKAEAERSLLLYCLALAGVLALCLYGFRIVLYRVIRPIGKLADALADAASGKDAALDLPAVAQGDEIGKLIDALHAFRRNVERIKEAEANLLRYTRALEHSNKELDDFAYIASHDLKEPLRGLFNNAKFLQEDYEDKLDEEGVRQLRRICYLCQRMETLVNDLLYFSRLGRQDLAIRETDINDVVRDVVRMTESWLAEHGASVRVVSPLPVIVCDKTRIAEAFRNLIVNGVKYNDKPEKTIEIGHIEKTDEAHGKAYTVFYVRDNGIGIEKEFHEEVFRIFKRLQEEDDDKKGTGVGLTFVKKIVERHGGHIWIESEVGKGSTFYFTVNQGESYGAAA
jgi:signal transduction histidine kinase